MVGGCGISRFSEVSLGVASLVIVWFCVVVFGLDGCCGLLCGCWVLRDLIMGFVFCMAVLLDDCSVRD